MKSRDARKLRALAGHVVFAPVYNVTGVGEDIDRWRAQMAADRAALPTTIVQTVQKAKTNRILSR